MVIDTVMLNCVKVYPYVCQVVWRSCLWTTNNFFMGVRAYEIGMRLLCPIIHSTYEL